MSKLYRHIMDCAAEHAAHRDFAGAGAIKVAATIGETAAKRRYPEQAAAIANAFAFARQETGPNPLR